jgi:phage-related protein
MGSNTLEVVLNLIDNLSPTIDSATNAVNSLQSTVDSASATIDNINPEQIGEITATATAASSSVENLSTSADSAQAAVDNIDPHTIENLANSTENAGGGLDNLSNAADSASTAINSIDPSALNNVSGSAQAAANNMEQTANASDAFLEIGGAIAGLGLAAFLEETASAAGDFGDRFLRMSVVFKETNASVADMKEEWTGSIKTVQAETGKGFGVIQEEFIKLGKAGIQSKQILTESFNVISGTAFLMNGGQNIEAIEQSYNKMVQTGKVGARQLVQLGINENEILKATGMTVKELTDNFGKYAPEERAAMLNSILNTAGAAEGNKKYQESFEHLKESAALAFGGITRAIGSIVLPLLIPAMKTATVAVNKLKDGIVWFKETHPFFATIAGGVILVLGSFSALILILIPVISLFKKLGSNILKVYKGIISIPGKIQNIAGRIKDFGGRIKDFGSHIRGIGGNTSTFVDKIKTAGESVKNFAGRIRDLALAKNAETAATNRGIIARIRDIATTIWSTIVKGANTIATTALAAATWLWNVAIMANPIGALIVLIIGLVAAIIYLWNTNEGFRNALLGTWDAISTALAPAVEQLTNLFNRLKDAFSILTNAWSSGKDPLDSLGQSLSKIPEFLGTALLSIVDWALDIDWIGMFEGFVSGIENMINNVASFLTNMDWGALLGSLFGGGGKKAGDNLVQNVEQTASPSKFQELFNKVVQKISEIDWTGVLLKIGELLIRIYLIIWTTLPKILIALVMGIGEAIGGAIAKADIPGKIWNILIETLLQIGEWELQLITYATNAATGFINAFIGFISQLPGRAWLFLIQTIQRIGLFAISAYSQAKNAAIRIISAIQSTLTSLPGKMYTWGMNALNTFVNGIINTIPGLRGALDMISGLFPHSPPKWGPLATIKPQNMRRFGEKLGQNLNRGLDSTTNSLFQNLPNIPSINQNIPPNPSNISLPSPTISPDNLNTNYQVLDDTNTETWHNMVSTTKTDFDAMQKNIQSTLTNITDQNQTGYDKIGDTTQNVLSSLKTQTQNSMNSVTNSWKGMKDGLISAASHIHSKVGTDISRLTHNIARFYQRIRNPSLLLAGPRPGVAGPGKIHIPRISGFSAGPGDNRDLNFLDNAPYIPCISEDGCYAGGWDFSNPWISTIMDRVKGYIPNFGDFGNLGLKVRDFEKTSMPLKGQLGAFSQIAANLIGKTRYSFYYNSRYGSPSAALQAGAFNCYDGALIMLALARAFGLSGRMEQGHWGNVGHVWANIAGKTFDTTAKQHGYGWSSPKVHAGPLPRSSPYYQENNAQKIKIEDHITLELDINLENSPKYLDEEKLGFIFGNILSNSSFLKKFVKAREFKDALKIELAKQKGKTKRINGA